MNILIHNIQAFGDCLIGTHLAKFIKQKHPNSYVIFSIPNYTKLTTAENKPNQLYQMLEVFALQDDIDDVGIYSELSLATRKGLSGEIEKIYLQSEWFSNLGIVKSALLPLAIEQGWDGLHTETKFNVGTTKQLPSHLRVATVGWLDWNRKLGNWNEYQAFLSDLHKHDIEIIKLGTDVSSQSLLKSLQDLNNCHLYIGPAGALGHAAAGLGLDTIIISEVFPPEWLAPEYYHSGAHLTVTAKKVNHCGSYKCVTVKDYDPKTYKMSWRNPKAEFGFWPKFCSYMDSGKSCISTIDIKDISSRFNIWYRTKWQPR